MIKARRSDRMFRLFNLVLWWITTWFSKCTIWGKMFFFCWVLYQICWMHKMYLISLRGMKRVICYLYVSIRILIVWPSSVQMILRALLILYNLEIFVIINVSLQEYVTEYLWLFSSSSMFYLKLNWNLDHCLSGS